MDLANLTQDNKPKRPGNRFDSVYEQCQTNLLSAQQLLEQILSNQRDHDLLNTLVPFNELQIHVDSASSLAGLLAEVHPEKSIRDVAESCTQQVQRFVTELSLNRPLYEALTLVNSKDLDEESKRMLTKTLLDFKRSGVDKNEVTRAQIKKIEEELVLIGQEFNRNIREDVRSIEVDAKAGLKGLPADYIAAHAVLKNGKVRITTDYPDYIPFLMYADNADLREELWKKYNKRGYPKNEPVLDNMLKKRYELAKALGYDSYSDYVVEDKMIKSTAKVSAFIEQITEISQKGADQEYAILLGEKRKEQPLATQVFGYERAFLEEKVKKNTYQFESQAVRPYFQFEKVRDGLLQLTSDLFDIRYVKDISAPVWHHSVEVYDVFNGSALIGRIYLDLHPRENKFKHAAQFTLKSGLAKRQIAEGVLVCNFSDPSASSEPALMDHDQVVTFFHEFGHLLHHILGGQQKWIGFSGVATEWDFVEAPSQLFEEWAWDYSVLQRFAHHHKSGESIPKNLIERMRAADEFGKGMDARQQMFYAALSLQYHKKDPATFNTLELLKSLQTKYSKFPYVADTHFHMNFGHLEGYSAMYYTYMWSKVIAKDLLSPFKIDGMLNAAHAKRYKQLILEKGGSKDADELVADFLGRPYEFDAFRQWLETTL